LTPVHEVTLELGYDLSHQDFVAAARRVTSHSVRAFLGYQLKPAAAMAVRLSVDVLGNLAAETSPTRRVPALRHERVLGRAELDLKVNAPRRAATRRPVCRRCSPSACAGCGITRGAPPYSSTARTRPSHLAPSPSWRARAAMRARSRPSTSSCPRRE
jgi:hypothetical protein